MASRRMIASDIWRDDFIGGLDLMGRVLWIGLIVTCADDQGRLVNNAKLIRSDVFPLDDIALSDIESRIADFAKSGKIIIYEAGGKSLIQIINWWEYQTPSWASPSRYNPPTGWVDREKYHTNGNKIASKNWDKQGGFQSLPSDLPSQLPSDLPSGIEDVKGEGEYIAPTAQEKDPTPTPEELPPCEESIVKNPGAFAALQAHETGRKNGKPDVSWLSENLRPNAEAFIVESGIVPTKAEQSKWHKWLLQYYEAGIRPKHTKKAVVQARLDGLAIGGPESTFKIARSLMTAEQNNPDHITY